MMLLALSLFETGLMVTILAFLFLYLVVLLKLSPSTRGREILRPKAPEKKLTKKFAAEEESNPDARMEFQEESVERAEPTKRIESSEKPEHTQSPPTKTWAPAKKISNSGCPYHFQYLKEHPKNTPIPNECLTCLRIMECLLGAA